MLQFTKQNKAEKRRWGKVTVFRGNRELPAGARQSEENGELASELPAEGCGARSCVGSDGYPAVGRGRDMAVS